MSHSTIENRTQRLALRLEAIPIVTYGIILINVAAYLLSRGDLHHAVLNYGLIPSEIRIGRLFICNFLHDGPVHLALNMLQLYLFGRRIERVTGKLEYCMFYIGACFAASLLHVGIVYATLPPYYATRAIVGASGAVAGVMGVYAVRFHRENLRIDRAQIPALLVIMVFMLVQLILGILGLYRDNLLGFNLRHVAYWSHLGGFGFGVAVALLGNMALQGEREYLTANADASESEDNLLEAAREYELLLTYDPDNAFAYAQLGRIWALLREESQSLPYYNTAIDLFSHQGREEEALEVSEQMTQFWKSASLSPDVRFRLATYLDESGQPRKAEMEFRRIADLFPESPEAQMSLLKVGVIRLTEMNDPAGAVSTLTSFLNCYPDSEWRKFAEETIERARNENV